jgi:muramidase (phage lysozyme)
MTEPNPATNLSSPAVRRRAVRCEKKLGRAVALASKRESRKNPVIAALYKSARVEGSQSLRIREATIVFSEPPFREGLYQIYGWQALEDYSERDLAAVLAWSLRQSVRRATR